MWAREMVANQREKLTDATSYLPLLSYSGEFLLLHLEILRTGTVAKFTVQTAELELSVSPKRG